MTTSYPDDRTLRELEYREKGYWGDATLLDYWNTQVARLPEKECAADNVGTRYTFAGADGQAARLAGFLASRGVSQGDVVTLQMPICSEFLVAYIACLKLGAVVTPIPMRYRVNEVLYTLEKTRSKAMITATSCKDFSYVQQMDRVLEQAPYLKTAIFLEKYSPAGKDVFLFREICERHEPYLEKPDCKADDLAVILWTSGTTGRAKGVMLSHNNIIAAEKMLHEACSLTEDDVMFMPSPLNHAVGFHHGLTSMFMRGGKVVLLDKMNAEKSIELIRRERCTYSMGATPFIYDILKEIERQDCHLDSIRFFLCGGAPILRGMVESAYKRGYKVLGVYGSTESVPHVCIRPEDSAEKVLHYDGRATDGVELKIVDGQRQSVSPGIPGEEASRGPHIFMGYYKDPEATARTLDDKGWYYSGDLCVLEGNGYLRVTGRIKDLIIRGGENLSCVEIEEGVARHPRVKDVVVVGMPDIRFGERICAYLVLSGDGPPVTLEEMKDFLRGSGVIKQHFPERLEIVNRLPRTESGKIQRFCLQKDITEKLKAEKLSEQ